MYLKKLLKISFELIVKKRLVIGVFFLLAFVIATNQIHYYYPDEFENILGGHYILSGRLPYTGFFSHHNPGAFYLSSLINIISGASFVRFRIVLGVLFLTSYVFFYRFICKRFGQTEGNIVLVFLSFITLGATFFWGHMFLADSLSAYMITPVFIILLLLHLKTLRITQKDIWVLSILLALTVLTTMTQIFACALGYLGLLILKSKAKNPSWKKFFFIVSLPYLLFVLYLLVTGSLSEYYNQAIRFNTDYYISLPDGVSFKNPLRVVIVLLVKFFQNFKTALLLVKDLNFGSPFIQTFALSNAVLLAYFVIKRKVGLVVFFWLFLSFINARGNPYTTSETDYQSIVYHFISIFNGILAITLLWQEFGHRSVQTEHQDSKTGVYHMMLNGLFILLSLYQVSLLFFFFDKWLDKSYRKYMGTQALIYDRPAVASVLNNLIPKDGYYFIGPFDFEDHLYMKSKLASKYIVVLPGMDNAPKMKKQILDDMENTKPKIVVFNTEQSIYQKYPGGFLKDYLNENYINLENMGVPCQGYKSRQKWYNDFDFERHFFLRKNQKDQLWALLLEQGLIYPVDKKEVESLPECIGIKHETKN